MNQTTNAGIDLDSLPRSTYENGPGNVPRLPDRVVDTLIDSAGVSRCAPGRTVTTVRDQTANVEQLVHDTCEELLARLPDLARRAEPSVAADERALAVAQEAAYPYPGECAHTSVKMRHTDQSLAFRAGWQARAALASPAVSQQTAPEPTNAEMLVALQCAERLLRAAGFAMTGTASSKIVAAIAAASAEQAAPAVSQKDGAGYCADCNSWGGEHRDNCKQRPERFSHAATTASAPVPHHFSCERKGYNPLCSGCEAEREAATASASIDNDEFWKHVIAYCKGVGNEGQALVDYVMSWHRAALARAPLPAQGSFEGRTVSVDVSTCDVDYGNRIFAELTGETGSDGTTLLAIETSRNFAAPSQAGDARDDNKESAK